MTTTIKRTAAVLAVTLSAGLALAGIVHAQQKTMSIGTGGTGGVYYPLGGAVANVLSKNLPNVQATAEVTGGPSANPQPNGAGKGRKGAPTALRAPEAIQGTGKLQRRHAPPPAPPRAYPSRSRA